MHMTKSSVAEFILYVSNQEASRNFYKEILLQDPCLDVPGMTAFDISPGVRLGLMPEQNIARIIHPSMPHPTMAQGIPRCELYLYVEHPQTYFERAISCGAIAVSDVMQRNWGDIAGYVADPDGHILAFASHLNS